MASRIRGKRCCLHTSREARATKRRRESGGEAPSRKPQAASSKIQRSSKSQASRSKFQDQDPRSKIKIQDPRSKEAPTLKPQVSKTLVRARTAFTSGPMARSGYVERDICNLNLPWNLGGGA